MSPSCWFFHTQLTVTTLLSLAASDTTTTTSTIAPTSSPTLDFIGTDCSVEFPSLSSSYNLCPLSIGRGSGQLKYYKVQDSRFVNTTTTSTDYTYDYYFNIGDELAMVPPVCANVSNTTSHKYCPPKYPDCSNGGLESINGAAYAYQVRVNSNGEDEDCWALSSDDAPVEWALLDEEDPSLGVQLTYINGDYDSYCGSNRKFQIRFECENTVRFIPDEIPLYEYTPCEYTLSIPSQYGCPIECNIYDFELCSDHGLCGYDNSNGQSRCFCFDKFSNEDCSVYNEDGGLPEDYEAKNPRRRSPFAVTFEDADGTGVDVTYDLMPFRSSRSHSGQNGGFYEIHDKQYQEDPNRSFVYYVGISTVLTPGSNGVPSYCANVTAPCEGWDDDGNCNDYDADAVNQALVFQVNEDTEQCWMLGRFNWPLSPTADLYDDFDPARGVTILFHDGSWCDAAKINREFMVHLICPRDFSAVFGVFTVFICVFSDPYTETAIELYEFVEEESTCIYEFTMESALACPIQCLTNASHTEVEDERAFTVCSQKGICAADPEAGFVRCLCDEGWTGPNCHTRDTMNPTTSPTLSPTITGYVNPEAMSDPDGGEKAKSTFFILVIIVLAIVIVTVCGVGFVVYRNQKLQISQQEDEIAFHKMSENGSPQSRIVTTSGAAMPSNVVVDEKGKRGFATIDTKDLDEPDDGDDIDGDTAEMTR